MLKRIRFAARTGETAKRCCAKDRSTSTTFRPLEQFYQRTSLRGFYLVCVTHKNSTDNEMDKSAFQFNKNDVSRTIVCFGSPLLDSIVRVDGAFLKAHSLGANSAQLIEEASFFEKVLAKKCKVGIGGSVTNTARVLQAVLKRKRAVTYVGAIGSDADGRTIKRTLEDEGVRCVFKECRDASTGRCAVLVHGDKRSLCTDLGASKLYSLEDFNDARLQNCLALATSVYISVSNSSIKTQFLKHNSGILFRCFSGVCE